MAFGERTITIDCDVLQADGGTRTAAITGGAIALADACAWIGSETEAADPFGGLVAAVSVGLVAGEPVLDLSYAEDRMAGVLLCGQAVEIFCSRRFTKMFQYRGTFKNCERHVLVTRVIFFIKFKELKR